MDDDTFVYIDTGLLLELRKQGRLSWREEGILAGVTSYLADDGVLRNESGSAMTLDEIREHSGFKTSRAFNKHWEQVTATGLVEQTASGWRVSDRLAFTGDAYATNGQVVWESEDGAQMPCGCVIDVSDVPEDATGYITCECGEYTLSLHDTFRKMKRVLVGVN